MTKLEIYESERKNKKLKAIFYFPDGKRKIIHFGAKGYEDFTIHHSKKKKEMYIMRHKNNENWSNPFTAGTLSRYILWGETETIEENLELFKKMFNFE